MRNTAMVVEYTLLVHCHKVNTVLIKKVTTNRNPFGAVKVFPWSFFTSYNPRRLSHEFYVLHTVDTQEQILKAQNLLLPEFSHCSG
jgi:hypothetical protein